MSDAAERPNVKEIEALYERAPTYQLRGYVAALIEEVRRTKPAADAVERVKRARLVADAFNDKHKRGADMTYDEAAALAEVANAEAALEDMVSTPQDIEERERQERVRALMLEEDTR